MNRKRLVWQLFPSLWLITFIAMIAVTFYISQTFEQFYLEQVVVELQNKATIVNNHFTQCDDDVMALVNDDYCSSLFNDTETRLTIVDADGMVRCDSEEESVLMEDHSQRPEISRALSGDIGVAVRYSNTIKSDFVYVAVPIIENRRVIGAIRASRSVQIVHEALMSVYFRVALGGLAVMILILLASLYTSKRVSDPLETMRSISNEYARGKLSHRMPDHDSHEIGGLVDSMNQMAIQLNDRINTIIRQKNEQQAVLSSMVEGVLAIDLNERVININAAAESMLNVSDDLAHGRYIYEVLRNTQIQDFVKRSLAEQKAIEGEIVLDRGKEYYIQAHGAALRDGAGKHIGTVIVLNDITKIRELENMRRDFVANVSHELKTPITSIKGFVETLQDGAINSPDDARRFLSIIIKQTERLNGIIEDLLNLSRIEENEEKAGIAFEMQELHGVLKTSLQTCDPQAKESSIRLELECAENLSAKINEDLIHQAMVNLLNNAIKYSPEGGTISVMVERDNDFVNISVKDDGIGIPKEDQQRIFERFYRVDKERSRQLGGTGLGLSIVKHIVIVHKGKVSVESNLGKGSIFTISIPHA